MGHSNAQYSFLGKQHQICLRPFIHDIETTWLALDWDREKALWEAGKFMLP